MSSTTGDRHRLQTQRALSEPGATTAKQVVMYQKKGAGDETNLTLGSVFNQTAYLQQLVTVDVRALLL